MVLAESLLRFVCQSLDGWPAHSARGHFVSDPSVKTSLAGYIPWRRHKTLPAWLAALIMARKRARGEMNSISTLDCPLLHAK
ncbi:hypothetical protein LOAG_02080 [Loa loa]|uniref:Uncharacterized protein n=1 Tax=Loa loa TaxID=7209 RepID=A0A1S0U895_LOALO|nr:hypothetical protein LOAG_02080 [Loa loa]EFO26405.1 hypothetical protein LOAG_02080 [Loa loa]